MLADRFVPYERRWTGPGDGPMPITHGQPDLPLIVPERWAKILVGLSARGRWEIVDGLARPSLCITEEADVRDLIAALPPPPDQIARDVARAGGVGVPAPTATVPQRRRFRQVSVRLDRDDYGRLEAAAHIAGTNPTTLSRMLILGGMRKILADHGANYAQMMTRHGEGAD